LKEAVEVYAPPQGLGQVIFGLGAVEARLAPTLASLAVRRPLLICGRNVGASPLAEIITAAAGTGCDRFTGSREHTPIASIDAGAQTARSVGADGLIALGGSSAIDCAKGIAVLLRRDLSSVRDLPTLRFSALSQPAAASPVPPMPLVCIPTTLSGAEFQPFFGARDEGPGRKAPYGEAGLVSRTIFLDGEIAATTPARVWMETGVKALDDCLSRYCNAKADQPAFDAVQALAAQGLFEGLPGGVEGLPARRQANLMDVWLSTHPMPWRAGSRGPWFSTTARHALGGVIGLSHGAGSCVALVEGLGFHAAATGERQADLAARLNAGGRLAPAMAEWLERLGAPKRLRELGVASESLDRVAEHMAYEAPDLGSYEAVRAALQGIW
jgi:alcohol dehydrogenase class IV